MKRIVLVAFALGVAVSSHAQQMSGTLAPPSAFAKISDPAARSAALFAEAAKVMMHPRCVNCHPVGDRPSQGEGTTTRLHQPPVTRGADGFGAVTMRCGSCHQKTNYDPGHMPGHEHWHLAPLSMAWQGKTAGQICAQVKDPARNGNRTIAQVVEHMSHDALVGWAWAPGVGRTPAPGTQAELAALLNAWVTTGAACPAS
jgi:hypothetical protein